VVETSSPYQAELIQLPALDDINAGLQNSLYPSKEFHFDRDSDTFQGTYRARGIPSNLCSSEWEVIGSEQSGPSQPVSRPNVTATVVSAVKLPLGELDACDFVVSIPNNDKQLADLLANRNVFLTLPRLKNSLQLHLSTRGLEAYRIQLPKKDQEGGAWLYWVNPNNAIDPLGQIDGTGLRGGSFMAEFVPIDAKSMRNGVLLKISPQGNGDTPSGCVGLPFKDGAVVMTTLGNQGASCPD
jgi:hypothetical protein